MQLIRNFSIIAHIDHGKSTLADRIIQLCGGLSDREMEAQTVANCYTALDLGVEVVPVLNKIDLPSANPENAIEEIEEVIGIAAHDAVRCSAKTGEGVQDVLEALIVRGPPAKRG